MKTLEYSLKYEVCEENCKNSVAIITCAGSSQRMNGINKQFATILDIPVVVKSVLAFQNNKNISSIVISAKSEDIEKVQQLVKKYNLFKVTDIVHGGKSRAESVKNAFNCIANNTDYVIIHDGARPLVSQEVINKVISNLSLYKAVACGVPVKDTVKQVKENNEIKKTVDRNCLIAVQTPQAFEYNTYKNALALAKNLELFTDDCSLIENIGEAVYITEGDYKNIKITTKEDLIIANALAKEFLND